MTEAFEITKEKEGRDLTAELFVSLSQPPKINTTLPGTGLNRVYCYYSSKATPSCQNKWIRT